MARKTIKTISNKELKFIPDDMKDLDENAEKMEDRPTIVYGKKMTNDQRWEMKELMGGMNKYNTMIEGTGEALKYVWCNCVTKVCNVIIVEDDVETEVNELVGKDKDQLWDNEGMEDVLYGAVAFLQTESELNDEEVKTSV